MLNEQKAPGGIEWTRPYGRRGYTWNVVGGCMHDCKWTMPDGKIAECYAKTVAEGVAQQHYPEGFAHHYWHPDRLGEPVKLKDPSGIFMDSMSDLMGAAVPAEQIGQVLDVCRQASQHIFFLLTKNAPRLALFPFPTNVWVGASSPPDWMHGKTLNLHQQGRMLDKTLMTLTLVDTPVRWMSFEPLSWDVSAIVRKWSGALTWAVIGAASNGRNEYPPNERQLRALLEVLDDQDVPVFFKGNLRSLPWAASHWREDFPVRTADTPPDKPVVMHPSFAVDAPRQLRFTGFTEHFTPAEEAESKRVEKSVTIPPYAWRTPWIDPATGLVWVRNGYVDGQPHFIQVMHDSPAGMKQQQFLALQLHSAFYGSETDLLRKFLMDGKWLPVPGHVDIPGNKLIPHIKPELAQVRSVPMSMLIPTQPEVDAWIMYEYARSLNFRDADGKLPYGVMFQRDPAIYITDGTHRYMAARDAGQTVFQIEVQALPMTLPMLLHDIKPYGVTKRFPLDCPVFSALVVEPVPVEVPSEADYEVLIKFVEEARRIMGDAA